ncbi:glycosyltransferase [Candidatus Woesearchaeota archaeon]|nr:glycosyltransferase [Candidatus Woesearchaeota archaeon]
MKPEVSVVIPVYKDNRIIRCINSLMNQTYKDFEIIVIENGSNRFEKYSRKKKLRYTHLKEKNMAIARTEGVKKSRGRFILFTDADCVADPDWIKEMYKCLVNSGNHIVGGRIERYKPTSKCEIYCSNIGNGHKNLQTYKPVLDLPYVVLANAGFLRDSIVAVGYFDGSLISGNDVDICWKIQLSGGSIGLCQNAVIFHENRKTVRAYFKAHFKYATYSVLLFNKYASLIKKRKDKPWIINSYPIRLLFNSLRGLITRTVKSIVGIESNIYPLIFPIIEAIAIIAGTIYGSIKFRKLPLY